ncbi:MAG: ferredoxin [Elusimicrobiota bacterium]
MKVKVDEDLCTGCELCVGISPDIFKMSGDVAVAFDNNDPVPGDMEADAEEAASMCPVEAIIIEE